MFSGLADRVTCAARGRTLNGLALRQVAVLALGEEASLVAPDNPLKKPGVYLSTYPGVSEPHSEYMVMQTHIEE